MYDYDELDSIVGCFCTLLYPRRGQSVGTFSFSESKAKLAWSLPSVEKSAKPTVIEDLGTEVVVKLINGKEVVEYRDEILIND